MKQPLSARREVLASIIEPSQNVGLSLVSHGTAEEMLKLVKANGLEGVVAKRSDSAYQPGMRTGRWGQGLTAEKMKECAWVKPETSAETEFLEWTDAYHLRHTSFVRLLSVSILWFLADLALCAYLPASM